MVCDRRTMSRLASPVSVLCGQRRAGFLEVAAAIDRKRNFVVDSALAFFFFFFFSVQEENESETKGRRAGEELCGYRSSKSFGWKHFSFLAVYQVHTSYMCIYRRLLSCNQHWIRETRSSLHLFPSSSRHRWKPSTLNLCSEVFLHGA